MIKAKKIVNGPAGLNIPKGAKIIQPNPDQQDAAKKLVVAQWPTL
jgi:hypothetical protein